MSELTEYKKVAVKRFPRLSQRATAETRYWRKFKFPITVKEYGAISSISFCNAKPHDFAISSSTRVQVFAANTNKVKKTVSRFKDVAHSPHIRDDGKLMVAGDDSGLVQIFSMSSREVFRQFSTHIRPVRWTRFASFTGVVTGSDDMTVRGFDIPSGEETFCLKGHSDYVRCGAVNPASNDLVLSGSYDHTVKLWDTRTSECSMTMDHGAPVEDVLMFPGGGMVVSCGGNTIKVWDMLMGGRMVHSFSNHQKTVTSLGFDGSSNRLLSGSLDHHVKIYDVKNYKVVHSIKYSAPVMSLAMSPEDTHLVVGMADGTLSIRHKPNKSITNKGLAGDKAKKAPRGGTQQYFKRGQDTKASEDDFRVEVRRKKGLAEYDVFMKKFQYGLALDAALVHGRPVIIVSLIEELAHRDGLKIAISGRDEAALTPLLVFLLKHVNNPRYSSLLIEVTNMVLDVYARVLGKSQAIDELVLKLRNKVHQELEFQKRLMELSGAFELILAGGDAESRAAKAV
ncbi:hypothetical protein SARC_09220 [Sphaeroforma arctica JP610]|uniref:U3 small nucleolar RNA-associated protein 15 C-terminal domain-containing protein n=1 Tax=Sphaeroforma arctica JP610 TaxID=667725 RepID=A0A0L0FNH1_9EUKA|nr:hypothetical protein SARC_09220 [Sphaeroforma arctica JP610]KNC78347.1 hypothetical protein SARC_09220 [Sphaeroforma arctica JP610]|eukprot:XP_014152249.1 hypothetical protein SARC_09220 [Sphaeroforma arctica JP610]